MTAYPQDIRHLLYEDAVGHVVGLDEVQLLDPIPTERVASMRALLGGADLHLAYQAVLVLTAWGDPVGLGKLEEFVDARVDEKMEFAPHRISDYDNVYDELAEAVYLFGLSSVDSRDDRLRILGKLLALYGPCFFESKLKRALLRLDLPALAPDLPALAPDVRALAPDVRAALERALGLGRVHLASQLLPPLARWVGEAVRPLLAQIVAAPREARAPDPLSNVAEALGYLPGSESRRRLERYALLPNPAVSDEARRALMRLAAPR